MPPESDEALDAFVACADKVGLHRLHAQLRLEERRRAWEAELARLDRDVCAKEAEMRLLAEHIDHRSDNVETLNRFVDIRVDAVAAAKAMKPLHYGGHPSLAAAQADMSGDLDEQITDLIDYGYSIKSITPIVNGPSREAWGPDGSGGNPIVKDANVTTLVLLTAERKVNPDYLDHFSPRVCVATCLKKLSQRYMNWLLMLLYDKLQSRCGFRAPRGADHICCGSRDHGGMMMRELERILNLEVERVAPGDQIFGGIHQLPGELMKKYFDTQPKDMLDTNVDDLAVRRMLDALAEDFPVDRLKVANALFEGVVALREDLIEQHRVLQAHLEAAGYAASSSA